MSLPADLLDALMRKQLHKRSEFLFANQCAPVAYDLKPSELMMIENERVLEYEMFTLNIGKKDSILYHGEKKTAMLIYNEDAIQKVLKDEKVDQFLHMCHYTNHELDGVLAGLSQRIESYFMDGTSKYPHELGVLLGYPLNDVIGYIENEGKNYLYCGYWKVYTNLEDAKSKFEQYNSVRYQMISHLLE